MKPIKLIKFTKQGLEDLKKEYSDLEESRPAALKELVRARELGDLSENGLYTAAKARVRGIDGRLTRISSMIKRAQIYEAPKDRIGIGSRVTVEQNGKNTEYEIVGDIEADPINKKISSNSPIGRALINKKPGDYTEIQTPKGSSLLRIISINDR